jgi:hypothetical protein
VTLTRKKSEPRSTGKESSRTSRNTTEKKKKDNVSATKKNTLFLATSVIEGSHYVVTRLGRDIDTKNFKITYNLLKKLYEELE